MSAAMLGIIGGTGLYRIEGLEITDSRNVDTPFGKPSAAVTIGTLEGRKVAFLPRHGLHHALLPGEINYRANIWAFKSVGVRKLVGVSAVGSLRKEIEPGQLALPHQYFDWTGGKRAKSFFGDGLAAHISTAEPVCASLSKQIIAAAEAAKIPLHAKTTYACVEGPRLGTRAESFFLKNAGCDLVGMTNVPEAFLAREAQLCYCTIAIATDYDCWLEDPSQHVTVDKVMELHQKNLGRVKGILKQLVMGEPTGATDCSCRHSLDGAVLTAEQGLSDDRRKILAFLKE